MQVLLVLQSNALKFTQEGEVHTEVEIITNGLDDKYLRIKVTDTGIGILEED
jgi:signal transduction histidine kinase